MYQLATEGGGFGPRGFSMPGVDANNKKTYVYDIDHRSNKCMATVKLMDLTGVPAMSLRVCPVSTGARVTGTGRVYGYDMYGQYVKEELAGAASLTCFSSIGFADDGIAWTNEFGLPYRHAANEGLPAEVTYVPPADPNRRGAFTFSGNFPAEVTLDYTVDRDNMFGDVRDLFASNPVQADFTIPGTVTADGAVTIPIPSVGPPEVPTEVRLPDGQTAFVATGATYNGQLSDLWMQQYGRQIRDGQEALNNLVTVDVLGNEYPPVYVELTGTVAPPPEPVDEPVEEFTGLYDANGVPYFVRTADGHIGLNQDEDPDPDLFVTPQQVRDAGVPDETKQAVHDKLIELGFAGLPDWPPTVEPEPTPEPEPDPTPAT